ncbi:unnamed protein product, partial [marine sediment metagenome]
MDEVKDREVGTEGESYRVNVGGFEGPIELLLFLIRKSEINIYDIPISKITGQYLQYLSVLKKIDINLTSEFLVMAATLLLIKSKMLLPSPPGMEDEEKEDPREELVRQLIEYQRYKSASRMLSRR